MEKLRLSKSVVGNMEAEALSDVILKEGYLGMGKEVQTFESELKLYLNTEKDVICVNSGTAALHLAIEACVPSGCEVLVQSLTYVATFQAISAAGAIPVPCEVLPETITIDLDDAKRRITERTRAIMPVHYASNPGGLDSIYEFAGRFGLRVIEDAAHAFGCKYKGRYIGSFGDVVCFSFDGIKNITSGEGGAIVTSDTKVSKKVRDARLLGVEKDSEKRFAGERSWDFDVHRQGYRYHMSNIMAAIGRVQLKRITSEFGPKRIALANCYRTNLEGFRGLKLLESALDETIPHIQPIRVMNGKRDGLRQFLEDAGIPTGIHYKPNHLLDYYRNGRVKLPVTEQLYCEILSLPLHPELEKQDVDFVCSKIKEFFDNND